MQKWGERWVLGLEVKPLPEIPSSRAYSILTRPCLLISSSSTSFQSSFLFGAWGPLPLPTMTDPFTRRDPLQPLRFPLHHGVP